MWRFFLGNCGLASATDEGYNHNPSQSCQDCGKNYHTGTSDAVDTVFSQEDLSAYHMFEEVLRVKNEVIEILREDLAASKLQQNHLEALNSCLSNDVAHLQWKIQELQSSGGIHVGPSSFPELAGAKTHPNCEGKLPQDVRLTAALTVLQSISSVIDMKQKITDTDQVLHQSHV